MKRTHKRNNTTKWTCIYTVCRSELWFMKRVHSAIQHAFYSNTFLVYADWQLSTSTWYWHENAKKNSTITQEIEKQRKKCSSSNRTVLTDMAKLAPQFQTTVKCRNYLLSLCLCVVSSQAQQKPVSRDSTQLTALLQHRIFLCRPALRGRNHRTTATETSPILCLWKIWFHSQ